MLTAVETVKLITEKKLTAAGALEQRLKLIKEKDGAIGAFLEVFEASARAQAAAIDAKACAGQPLGRLAGVTVAIKDNMVYAGHHMTCASKILEGYVAPYTATAVQRLLDEDAIIIGRANMDEFAMGSSNENSAYQLTKNPVNTAYVPGGSSGGPAAAVAAGFCPVALGSDTGGSIRQPAAFCGVYGLKPTYGLVSRYGLVAFASSLDQIGPFTTNVEDSELILSVLAAHDHRDSTSVAQPPQGTKINIRGLRVGLPAEYFSAQGGIAPEVSAAIEKVKARLCAAGAIMTPVSLPHSVYAMAAYYIIASSEASSNLGRFDGIRYGPGVKGETLSETYKKTRGRGFGPEVKRRIMLGTYSLSSGYYDAYYIKAQKVRTLIKRDFDAAFAAVDVILTPTTPTTAFKFGEKMDDPIAMYLSDIFTVPCNLAGLCGISFPAGSDSSGLPIGAQLLAKPFNESALFTVVREVERAA